MLRYFITNFVQSHFSDLPDLLLMVKRGELWSLEAVPSPV